MVVRRNHARTARRTGVTTAVTATSRCSPARHTHPFRCPPDAGPPPVFFDGGAVTSSIGNDGGTESVLYFGIVGDTRSATADDTPHYPTSIITRVFDDLGGVTPVPPFVISTGDYQYSKPNGNEAAPQLQLYINSKAN